MKVVLLKDVRDMGRAGSVIDVADGHALNHLIPRKLGVLATAQAIKQSELMKKNADSRKELDAQLITETIAHLADNPVTITKKANDKGHLYDAVGVSEIAAATNLPEEAIKLEKPFKELGTFEVPVSAGQDFGSVSITIEAE
jgi:large subunit ribosomal protein L9